MKALLAVALLIFCSISYGQSRKSSISPRDKVVLKNGNSETGKIIDSDSLHILLQKYDHSVQRIPWSSIDTVTGLSYSTFFVSPGFSVSSINYFSTFRYDKVHSGGLCLSIKIGRMKRKHYAYYFQFTEMPLKPYNIFKTGVGFNYYIPNNYTKRVTTYVGLKFEMNSVETNNSPFFNYGAHFGVEYLTKNNNRFFIELTRQKTVFNIHNGNGVNFTMGIRFSREYGAFYKRLNNKRML